MRDNYIGVTIRKEVLTKDGLAINLKTLKSIAIEAMQFFHNSMQKVCTDIVFEKLLPGNVMIQEYYVRPTTDLRIKLSLDTENYAPFNSWIEVDSPNSKKWLLMNDLAYHLSVKFPTITFNVNSSFCFDLSCAEDEKYTIMLKNGKIVARLTRKEWAETYLHLKYGYKNKGLLQAG